MVLLKMALVLGEEGPGSSRPPKFGQGPGCAVGSQCLGQGWMWGEGRGVWGELGCLVWGVAGHGSREQVCDAQVHRREGPGPGGYGGLEPGRKCWDHDGSGRGWRPSLGPLGGGEEGPGQHSEVGAERGICPRT